MMIQRRSGRPEPLRSRGGDVKQPPRLSAGHRGAFAPECPPPRAIRCRERGGDAEADPASRSSDNRSFTFEEHSPPDIACRGDACAAVVVLHRPVAAARQIAQERFR